MKTFFSILKYTFITLLSLFVILFFLVFLHIEYSHSIQLRNMKNKLNNIPNVEVIDIWGHKDITLEEITARLRVCDTNEIVMANLSKDVFNYPEDVFINEINGYSFISRLIEGEFVNYKKTLPQEIKQSVVVSTRDLINTIERVSLLISESFSTPVRCYFNELNVVFTCATSVGRATETFNAKLEGESFEIGLNSRYLLEALKAIDNEKVEILFNGPNAGVVINEIDGESFKYIIMPQRLK